MLCQQDTGALKTNDINSHGILKESANPEDNSDYMTMDGTNRHFKLGPPFPLTHSVSYDRCFGLSRIPENAESEDTDSLSGILTHSWNGPCDDTYGDYATFRMEYPPPSASPQSVDTGFGSEESADTSGSFSMFQNSSHDSVCRSCSPPGSVASYEDMGGSQDSVNNNNGPRTRPLRSILKRRDCISTVKPVPIRLGRGGGRQVRRAQSEVSAASHPRHHRSLTTGVGVPLGSQRVFKRTKAYSWDPASTHAYLDSSPASGEFNASTAYASDPQDYENVSQEYLSRVLLKDASPEPESSSSSRDVRRKTADVLASRLKNISVDDARTVVQQTRLRRNNSYGSSDETMSLPPRLNSWGSREENLSIPETSISLPEETELSKKLSQGDDSSVVLQVSDRGELCSVSCFGGDDDDYGFLSYSFSRSNSSRASSAPASVSSLPAVCHKAKSAPLARAGKMWPKKLRRDAKKQKGSGKVPFSWTKESPCTWCHRSSGARATLGDIDGLALSVVERRALRRVALRRLEDFNLGVAVTPPPDERCKKSHWMTTLKRRLTHNSSESSSSEDTGSQVFGVPLSRVLANDRLQRRQTSRQTDSLAAPEAQLPRRPSSSQSQNTSSSIGGSDLGQLPGSTSNEFASLCNVSGDLEASPGLMDALSLSISVTDDLETVESDLMVPEQTIPHVVSACFRHLERHGLHVLGIFRVGSSKRRVEQLRDEFDAGQRPVLCQDTNPHDVASILKEFYRDLPEPLLTSQLYDAYIATRSLEDPAQQREALRLLTALLPLPSRDLLHALLNFLSSVTRCADDKMGPRGETHPGNRMDSRNLATLFGPNILRRSAGEREPRQTMAKVEEYREVVEVVKDLIDWRHDLFTLPASLHNDVMSLLAQTDPQAADVLFCRKASSAASGEATCRRTGSSASSSSGCTPRDVTATGSSQNDVMRPDSPPRVGQQSSSVNYQPRLLDLQNDPEVQKWRRWQKLMTESDEVGTLV